VVKSHVLTGQAVHAGDPVFTVADMRVVDVVAEIPEQSLPLVRIDQAATVSVAAFPATPFVGRVERLRNELNPETRTVRAVIHVSNSAGRLRPGMFATVRLTVPGSAYQQGGAPGGTPGEGVLTIPESALVTDGGKRYVFVLTAPRTFERREVEIAPIAPPGSSVVNSAFVFVRSGLKLGDQIVTRGAFTLKSELAKAGLGEHGH
jgi:RND family efflux transporter MFP subunit